MLGIIDRRAKDGIHSGRDKSIGNRQRFNRRYKDQIKEAVRKAVNDRGIKDVIGKGTDVTIPKKDLQEPVFSHGQGGIREIVHPGNKDYYKGDKIERPKGGQGGGAGQGQASDSGEGEDDFTFTLSKEDFMSIFFDDLALPPFVKQTLSDAKETKLRRAGYSTSGNAESMHAVRTIRTAIGRRIALGGGRERIDRIEEEINNLREQFHAAGGIDDQEVDPTSKLGLLLEEIRIRERVIQKADKIPYLDPIDLRFRNRVRVPVPQAKAVMFCLMDVSGSMDEGRKELAKRFFILLYLFLTRKYESVDIVFIRHHTKAQEVSEEEFFNAKDTGGTIVSSALELMKEIIDKRYPVSEWNIFGAQASDGDNWHHDSARCKEILTNDIMPLCQYFTYMQVAEQEQELWVIYKELEAAMEGRFVAKMATENDQIYPVFREMFRREGVDTSASRMIARAPSP